MDGLKAAITVKEVHLEGKEKVVLRASTVKKAIIMTLHFTSM